MGFALTVLYFAATYLGTETIFGPLVVFHVELIIALLAILVSLPSLGGSFVLKTPQSLALVGLALAVGLSVLATGWVGGALQAVQSFIPNAFAFFLICLHCNSRKKLDAIVLVLLFVCLFVIAHGSMELRAVDAENAPNHLESFSHGQWSGDYLLGMRNDAGQWFFRLRGKGFMNDPNDFAQLIVCVIPLMFLFWRPKKKLFNAICVLVPVCVLIYGAYLTHSRGCLLALLVMAFVAGRRRIGNLLSIILATGIYFAASVLHFTGGRDVSIDAGSGRMALWGGGLGLLKSHPLFGVGFGQLPDYLGGFTAHNSIVVCAAELGLFGLFFWSLFVYPTLRGAWLMASAAKPEQDKRILPENVPASAIKEMKNDLDRNEVMRVGQLILFAVTGFLVTGLFLSRAFTATLYLVGGMEEVFYEMAQRRGMISPRLRLTRAIRLAGVFAIGMVLSLYILLRITLH